MTPGQPSMNNTILKIIAAVLVIASVAVGYIGVKMSMNPPPPAPVAASSAASVPSSQMIVVTSRALPTGHRIAPSDIQTKAVLEVPPGAFRDSAEVLGRMVGNPLTAGAPLTERDLTSDSMASLLREGERAVAIQVDEVAGLGGYAQPGDRVDVLSYVTQPVSVRRADVAAMAQIVIHDARLLSLGDANQMDVNRSRAESSSSRTTSTQEISPEERRQRQSPRSAVLAVSEADTTRLMLAAASGQLRLALRPQSDTWETAPKDATQPSKRPDARFVNLGVLGVKGTAGGDTTGRTITIQEGSKEIQVKLDEARP